MRGPVLAGDEQIHKLAFAADGASRFAETRNVSVPEGLALETLRGQPLDGGERRNGFEAQPRNVSLKSGAGLEQVAAGVRTRRRIQPDCHRRNNADDGQGAGKYHPGPLAAIVQRVFTITALIRSMLT